MAGNLTVNAIVEGVDYQAQVEVHPSHPEIEEGYVLDIIKTSPEVLEKSVREKIYDICHDIVLKIAGHGKS